MRKPIVPTLMCVVALIVGCDTQGVIGDAPVDRPGLPNPEPPPPPFAPAPAQLLRLTAEQYANAVHDIYGEQVTVTLGLEPDVREAGFYSVGAGIDSVSESGVSQYEAQALAIAAQIMEEGALRDGLMECTPTGVTDDACAATFIRRFGRLTYRRTLTEDEVTRFVDLAREGATVLGDFHEGLGVAVLAQLQSPHFLYRHELGTVIDVDSDARELRGTELASRLSFFLWNTTPDDALIAAAEAGELDDPAGLEAHVRRMIDDPRTRRAVSTFFAEMLELDELDHLSKDRNAFLHFGPTVGDAAREETLLTIEDHIFEQDADYRDLFTTRRTYLNRLLASIYEVPAPAREGFAPYEHASNSMRRGLLGQLSFLALHAHPTRSSPTLRGRFVRINLLCTEIPPPPANVSVDIEEANPNFSLRDQLAEHSENPVCASCHALMDPIGLGFENFDGLGQYREIEWQLAFENGDVLRDENGDRVFIQGPDVDATGDLDGEPFNDPIELTQAIHDHPDLPSCLTRSLYRYATGHEEIDTERAQLIELTQAFEDSGYRVRELLVAVALSDGFRHANGLRYIDTEGE